MSTTFRPNTQTPLDIKKLIESVDPEDPNFYHEVISAALEEIYSAEILENKASGDTPLSFTDFLAVLKEFHKEGEKLPDNKKLSNVIKALYRYADYETYEAPPSIEEFEENVLKVLEAHKKEEALSVKGQLKISSALSKPEFAKDELDDLLENADAFFAFCTEQNIKPHEILKALHAPSELETQFEDIESAPLSRREKIRRFVKNYVWKKENILLLSAVAGMGAGAASMSIPELKPVSDGFMTGIKWAAPFYIRFQPV